MKSLPFKDLVPANLTDLTPYCSVVFASHKDITSRSLSCIIMINSCLGSKKIVQKGRSHFINRFIH